MALLALRIEGLAATEARLGTESANVLRRKVAVRLRSGLRASDVVASVGVDSFAVLLAWIDDAGDAEGLVERLGGVRLLQRVEQRQSFFVATGLGEAIGVIGTVSVRQQAAGLQHTLLRFAVPDLAFGAVGLLHGFTLVTVGKRH